MSSQLVIAPSILSADLGRLSEEIASVEQGGADWIHIDVMDGQFVPNLTLGPMVVAAARRSTALPLDVHLMMLGPERFLEQFAEAGASTLTVHVEACPHLQRTLRQIRDLGMRAGVVLNPGTHESAVEYVIDEVDQVLVMSVNPGFAGQAFLPSQLAKIERLRRLIDGSGNNIDLEVDGGIAADNVRQVVAAGANVVVAGTAVFGEPDRRAAIERLRRAALGDESTRIGELS